MTPEEAEVYYADLAQMVSDAGFNAVLGPVVDVDCGSPVISGLKRSFSADPEKASCYGKALVLALRAKNIKSCLKHYPGHGSAKGDTHLGVVDTTKQWKPEELDPFHKLIEADCADMVMTAHIYNKNLDEKYVATLSPEVLDRKLRKEGRFEGVIVTDDMHMGAIQLAYGFEEAVIQSIAAGGDLLIFSNNPAAAKTVPNFKPDPDIPEKVIAMVAKALQDGKITRARIRQSYDRIVKLKASLRGDK
jgi:beta-N-acetylhexosaminidase